MPSTALSHRCNTKMGKKQGRFKQLKVDYLRKIDYVAGKVSPSLIGVVSRKGMTQ